MAEPGEQAGPQTVATPPTGRSRTRKRWVVATWVAGWLIGCYVAIAYILAPTFWRHYEHHPTLAAAPKTTFTREGLPGDALNIGLVGSETEVVRAMLAAGWRPADPVTFRTSLGIARSVLFDKPYPTAPVSDLYLWGRKQDLAFEQVVGQSARQRHHVRFWRADQYAVAGREFWLGAATLDISVGLSHRTAKITHHISADIDSERDTVIGDLIKARRLERIYQVTGIGLNLNARNGNGDRYYTDGELTIGWLNHESSAQNGPPEELPNPILIRFKGTVWGWLKSIVE